jgi:hypothetical protein
LSETVAVAYRDGRVHAAVSFEHRSGGGEEWIAGGVLGSAHLGTIGAAVAARYAMARYAFQAGLPLLVQAVTDAREFRIAMGGSPVQVTRSVDGEDVTYNTNWSPTDLGQIVDHVAERLISAQGTRNDSPQPGSADESGDARRRAEGVRNAARRLLAATTPAARAAWAAALKTHLDEFVRAGDDPPNLGLDALPELERHVLETMLVTGEIPR